MKKNLETSLKLNFLEKKSYKHPYHLCNPSPWPFFAALGVFFTVLGLVGYMHFFIEGFRVFILGICVLLGTVSLWWRDVIREATFEGQHTSYVRKGLRSGMILFILSEVMFFFAFFWGFFHSSLNPTMEIGCIWPPKGIVGLNPWHVPLLNTFVLLTSGAFITWTHYSILGGTRKAALNSLLATIILALFFTLLQRYEYIHAPFNISDGIYGSTFYMITGLHGSHVIIGSIFLLICFYRLIQHHFTKKVHVGFESGSWYWHFVDIVWIFVYIFIYWWSWA